jgi:hypothetical protein
MNKIQKSINHIVDSNFKLIFSPTLNFECTWTNEERKSHLDSISLVSSNPNPATRYAQAESKRKLKFKESVEKSRFHEPRAVNETESRMKWGESRICGSRRGKSEPYDCCRVRVETLERERERSEVCLLWLDREREKKWGLFLSHYIIFKLIKH